MAMHDASSSSLPTVEEDEWTIGADSGWVEARTSCDHLSSLPPPTSLQIPPPGTPCSSCEQTSENWLCLICKEVLCSRFINKHMVGHYQDLGHCLALSYSDLSIWCFECEAYLDAQVMPQLRPVYEASYLLKFGERPPSRIPLNNCQ